MDLLETGSVRNSSQYSRSPHYMNRICHCTKKAFWAKGSPTPRRIDDVVGPVAGMMAELIIDLQLRLHLGREVFEIVAQAHDGSGVEIIPQPRIRIELFVHDHRLEVFERPVGNEIFGQHIPGTSLDSRAPEPPQMSWTSHAPLAGRPTVVWFAPSCPCHFSLTMKPGRIFEV